MISLSLVACEKNNTNIELNDSCSIIDSTITVVCSKTWYNYLHTVVDLKVYIDEDNIEDFDYEKTFNDIEDIIETYHKISDKYDTYPGIVNIKTINDDPTTTHLLSQELFDLLDYTLSHQDEVDNLFNIALGPVISIWHDYREDCNENEICAVPSLEELLTANQYSNPDDIVLNPNNLSITLQEHMSLDLGGISKGYISNIINSYLEGLNISGYILNNGESNISVGGVHPTRENLKFNIAITDPSGAIPYYASVYLSDGDQVVTSADYQQFYMVDGELYHHIISSETLFPERFCRSVSIISSDAALSDLYSTAIFLMPIEEGIAFVSEIEGLEAIWYDLDGTIFFSSNFESQYLNQVYAPYN